MTVKTCVVIGHSFMNTSQRRIETDVFESAVFGYSCEYETADSFIKAVRDSHRKVGSSLTITNVVIG